MRFGVPPSVASASSTSTSLVSRNSGDRVGCVREREIDLQKVDTRLRSPHESQLHIASHNNSRKTQTERIQTDIEERFPNVLYPRDGAAGFGCGIYENDGREIQVWTVDLILIFAVDWREVFWHGVWRC